MAKDSKHDDAPHGHEGHVHEGHVHGDENDPNVIVAQFQMLQQQLQQLLMQKESLNVGVMEIERANEELCKSKDQEAYKITGNIMVRKPVDELKKELAESKEDIEVRIKSMEATEQRFTAKLTDLQNKLKSLIK
ncbi:MAG: prefoldin subunit [Candidatus Aenigmarchaeota archaeon]|nr:prefoldin subunit [Candidatus Aenigmarchaeota archaeon]